MKLKAKILTLILVLATLISLVGIFAIPASAATAGDVLYMSPSSNWMEANARFAAYFFGAGDTWVSMTDSDGDGVYEVTIPSGGYTNVIFCRMNPSALANNWNNKWNQSPDLTLGDGTKNHYVVSGWDSGSWGTITYKTIYFNNNVTSWSKVNCYAWNTVANGTEVSNGWPGKSMTSVGNGIYSFVISSEIEKVIFNNGSTQTANISVSNNGCLWTPSSTSNKMSGSWSHDYAEATCTTPKTCKLCGATSGSAVASNHNYTGTVSYSWKLVDGNYVCTASQKCSHNAQHTREVEATATRTAYTAPTCSAQGSATYSATFTDSWCADTKTHTVNLDAVANAHNFTGEVSYKWNADYTVCTATQKCEYDKSHTRTATSTSVERTAYTAPTCSAQGSATYSATFTDSWCAGTKTQTVNLDAVANAHNFTGAAKSDENGETHSYLCKNGCGTYGNSTKCSGGTANCATLATCSTCNQKYGSVNNNHSYDESTWAHDKDGHWRVCSNGCGIPGSYDEHTPNIDAATETQSKVCTICEYVIEKALDHTTHNYTVAEHDITHHWNKCYGCDLTTEKKEHAYSENVTTPATCTSVGSKHLSCTCGYEKDVEIPQLEHSYTGAIKSDGNGENATHSYKCVNGCNNYGAAVAHTWNGGVETTAPKCEVEGVKTYTCTVDKCGATYNASIDALAHIDANTDHKCDRNCGKIDMGTHADSATDKDHVCDYGCRETLENCSDANNDGDHKCDVCQADGITEHEWVDATCTAPKTCSECSATEGKKLGHDMAEATCTAPATCKRGCGYTEGEANGHSNKDGKCTVCGENDLTYTIIVYFRNDWNWTEISCYYWGVDGSPEWPGTAMTLVDSGATDAVSDDIYAVKIPYYVTGIIFSGIKDDGSGYRDQSPNITEGWKMCLTYYMHWDNGNQVGTIEMFHYDATGDGNHACDYCGKADVTSHSGGTATCLSKATCEECESFYGNKGVHKFGEVVPQIDSTCEGTGIKAHKHCPVCDLYYLEDATASESTANGASELTHRIFVIGAKDHDYSGSLVDNGNGTHSKLCVNGCGKPDADNKTAHNFAGDWNKDAEGHWQLCACGANNKTDHTGAAAVVENKVDSTCYSIGSYDSVVYCSKCAAELSRTAETIAKKEHTPAAAVVENFVDSTCYAEGSYNSVVYCSVEACKHEISRTPVVVEKKAHTPAAAVVENYVDSTCTATGSYDSVVYCSVEACKHEISRTPETVDKKGHSYTNYIYNNNATCTNNGTETAKCDRCDVTDTRIVDNTKLGHNFATVEAEAATCQAAGHNAYLYCDKCENNYKIDADTYEPTTNGKVDYKNLEGVVIAKLGHSYTGEIQNDGNGTHSFKCVNGCEGYGAAVGHTFDKQNAVAGYLASEATCTKKATYYVSCACGAHGAETFEDGGLDDDNHTGTETKGGTEDVHSKWSCCGVTISTEHDLSNWTYVNGDSHKKSCDCGYEIIGTHNKVDLPAVEENCTETGLTAGVKCSDCGHIFVEQQVITTDADKHVYGDDNTCDKCEYVAEGTINGVHYNTLQEAVNAGGEITLNKDVQLSETLVISKNVEINTGAYTIYSTAAKVIKITANVEIEISGTISTVVPTTYAMRSVDAAQVILTVEGAQEIVADIKAELVLGDSDVIYQGDVKSGYEIYVKKAYREQLAQGGYLMVDAEEDMVRVIGKQVYYIGTDGYWYLDGVSTGVVAEGKNGESITIVGEPTSKPGTGNSTIYTVKFSDGKSLELTVFHGADGKDGNSIKAIQTENVLDGDKVIGQNVTIHYTDKDSENRESVSFYVPNGKDGQNGNSIVVDRMESSVSGKVITYTVYFTNGQHINFSVTNGEDGAEGNSIAAIVSIPPKQGGVDGQLITITYTKSAEVTEIFVPNGKDGANGSSITVKETEKTTVDNVDTYVVKFSDDTSITFTVSNGVDGKDGNSIAAIVSTPHEKDGVDGQLITITYTKSAEVTEFFVPNGAKGEAGDSLTITDSKHTTEGKVHTYVISFSDGSELTYTVTDGADGADGNGIKGIHTTETEQNGVKGKLVTVYYTKTDAKGNSEASFFIADGKNGEDGNGIKSVETTTDAKGNTVVTIKFTKADDITITIPKGDEGNSIKGVVSELGEKDGVKGQWITITYTDSAEATKLFVPNGKDGASLTIIKTEKVTAENVDTYTITFSDGTTVSYNVIHGIDGEQGDKGDKGETGADGETPYVGENGNWWVGDYDLGVPAAGEDGEDGNVPYIGENGNWWIGDTDLGVPAQGKDGNDNNKVIVISIAIATLCLICTIVAISTRRGRRPWWILC